LLQARSREEQVADEKKNDKVRVIDRRWFDERGELKDPAPPEPPAPPPPQSPPAPVPTEPQAIPAGSDKLPSKVGFLDLVDFLAQQAVALLSGQVLGRGRDPGTARFFIDLLGVVQEKTAGQLAPEENRYLEDILYQLRSLFVAATR
jgi:Domain of unknown function (DUF1844)